VQYVPERLKRLIRPLLASLFPSNERLRRSLQRQRTQQWMRIEGDHTLRLDYDIGPQSVVFDVGGFRGDWAQAILDKYGSEVYVFEPVPVFAQTIRARFREERNVHVFEFGLSDHSACEVMSVAADGSSFFRAGDNRQEVQVREAMGFLRERNIEHIDLMKINIEGGEYALLDHLIAISFVQNIDNIQVQFHDVCRHARRRARLIQKALAKTHRLTYQFPFVWENWKRMGEEVGGAAHVS
jgi:FkbM family methyltransferase